jgi:ubiquinol-cytochrome c reductase cytochrome b subunit/menaquinol-cytochrome c reductase cytochrome b/c subunit
MAFLTIEGALAGPPTQIDLKVAPQYEAGKNVMASSGCLGCHRVGDNGNSGPGPNLTHVASRLPRQAIARTLVNPTAPMPSYSRLQQRSPKEFAALTAFLGSLK